MQRFFLPFLAALAFYAALAPARADASGDSTLPDAAQDFRWERLPARWEDGAALGNALVGIVMHETTGDNRVDFRFAHRDAPAPAVISPGATTAPGVDIGRLVLRPTGWILQGELRTHLASAETTARVETNLGVIRLRVATLRDHPVHLIELGSLERFADGRPVGWGWEFRHHDGAPPAHAFRTDAGVTVFAAPLAQGGAFATAWQEQKNADGRGSRVFVSTAVAADESRAAREAVSALRAVAAVPTETLLTTHRAAWHDLYRRGVAAIPEAKREQISWAQIHQRAAQPFAPWPAAPAPEFSEP